MSNGISTLPIPKNEPISSYAPNSPEKKALQNQLKAFRSEVIDIPMYINGKDVKTNNFGESRCPHDHQHLLAKFHKATKENIHEAIDTALAARQKWAALPWENRAAVFLRAADLITTTYRYKINAATMLTQSKNAFQAEIDSVCEFADFLRFNVKYMEEIYSEQPPENSPGCWNRVEYRGLEGFILAITPFNFTAIAGNLPACAAMMGNVVVWKPSDTQVYSAKVIIDIFKEAGLPDGVINVIFGVDQEVSDIAGTHPDLAGIHFTGSTKVFRSFWKLIGDNIDTYKSYPRIVGETGGKDFIVAHPSFDDIDALSTALVRGSFEFQGQKCSAASRAYIPKSLWPQVLAKMKEQVSSMKVGPTEDFSNFINAVIDKRSFDKISGFIDKAKASDEAEIVIGGTYDDSKGYFIDPTVILCSNPHFTTMVDEIFGPVLSIFVYDDEQFEETLKLVDTSTIYALTGSILSKCRYGVQSALEALEHTAGNFYINDKCTGAVVGQQPFGGSRASGTNDKAGSKANLQRWVSTRTIKEVLVPATDYTYPFLG
ncbi:MAG: 1-pyrroline-5-carboxylate dehydrogenase [Candidatus Cloacimonadota bacterium]|nr:MAG: 1-pyrroline-5-carboxylate dehydrogenase [Candidatus Cloacimonadota bacterium]